MLGVGQVITCYYVQYGLGEMEPPLSPLAQCLHGSSTTSYTVTNLNLGTVYEVRVASVGPLGLSGYCCGCGKEVTTYDRECVYSAWEAISPNDTLIVNEIVDNSMNLRLSRCCI